MTDEPGRSAITRPARARPRAAPASTTADQEPPTGEELATIERAQASLPRFSGAVVRDDPDLGVSVAILRGRGPGYNFCACPRWPEHEVGGRLEGVARFMHEEGEWPALLVADGVSKPDDLASRLANAGWFEAENERIMWTRAAPAVPHVDPALRLEAVTARSAAEYERVEREIFGLPENFAAQRTAGLSYAINAGSLRAYLVRLNGEAVATARLAAADGAACIFGVGVVPAQRRRGLGTLVTSVATRAGLASGSTLVWLSVNELNDPALRVYRRLGYQPAFAWSRWVLPAI